MRAAILALGAVGGTISWPLKDGEFLYLSWSGIDDHFEMRVGDGEMIPLRPGWEMEA